MPLESVPIVNQPLRRLGREEYDQLAAQGAFADERVELLFGMVVAMSPTDPAHTKATARLMKRLTIGVGDRAEVRCQSPIAATVDSEPEPDLYLTPNGDYWREHPSRAYLVIEVANTSLAYDRAEKARLYGLSEVDEYWIVDLVNRVVEVRRDRMDGVWRSIVTFRPGDVIQVLAFPDLSIAVSEILPPT